MARQKGAFKFTGTIDGVTYYNSKYGPLVRKKGGPTAEQVKKDPAFKRVRENGKEFGNCGKATKLLRATLKPMMIEASDFLVTGRMNKLMHALKNLDTTSARGKRTVAKGVSSPQAKNLIKGFDFNQDAPLSRVLKKSIAVSANTGTISVSGLNAKNDMDSPKGATHAKFTGAWLKVDFAKEKANIAVSNSVALQLNSTVRSVRLKPKTTPGGKGTDIFVLQVTFYQEINGLQYSFKDGAYNSMALV
jgi:hypothetical protein